MRFKKLDLNLLVTLDALLQERNISRAAERVNLSQPAMSNALGRLREYFGDELLIPVGRQMMLTPRAESLQQPVREILLRVDSDVVAPAVFDPATSIRSFSMLVSDFTTTVFMPPLLRALYASAPLVQIHLEPQGRTPHELLEEGEADFLIIPMQYVSSLHPCVPLFEDDYVVVSWEDHPTIRDSLSREQYLQAGHVVSSIGSGGNRNLPVLEGWFLEREGIARKIEVTASTMAALPSLVVGTARLATVHRRIAMHAQQHLPIRIWPSPMKIPKLVQMLQWNKVREADPGLRWIRDLCLEIGSKI
ncbi:MAG: LysR family transcriptional regulator [Limnohabitans sp.]